LRTVLRDKLVQPRSGTDFFSSECIRRALIISGHGDLPFSLLKEKWQVGYLPGQIWIGFAYRCKWVSFRSASAALQPLFDVHREFVLVRVLHADETPVDMLDPGAGKRPEEAYVWAYARAW
jgi:hypothetical protein